jgi:hypothetical protein
MKTGRDENGLIEPENVVELQRDYVTPYRLSNGR